MAEVTSFKEPSNRHLRFKLQSLSRRLDDLEEATRNLQKAEDEVLDLQDKIIQAEGSNSSMLAEVEALRKRVLKIEGKDEEIRKAEELCRQVKEKLEEEESLSKQLRSDIEQLQKQMADLEKLEEAFSRSKSDCMQLCLSLNEEKNLTKKLSTELDLLRVKVKELESSESKLDKSEQQLASELEKLKSLTLSFVSERKGLLEREKQSEKLIEELTQTLEKMNKKNADDQTRKAQNRLERSSDAFMESNELRIEDDLIPQEGRRKRSFDYLKLPDNETNKDENEKNKNQEDNKLKELNQEIEKLKIQLKHFEAVEEELEKMQTKNNDLQERYLSEQNKARLLSDQVQELMTHAKKQKDMENGEAEREEILSHERLQHDRAKNRGSAVESSSAKYKSQELSPQPGRVRPQHRDISLPSDGNTQGTRQPLNTGITGRRAAKTSFLADAENDAKRAGEKVALPAKEVVSMSPEAKKSSPSVLSRYPPAAHEQPIQKSWKATSRLGNKVERTQRTYGDALSSSTDKLNGDTDEVTTAGKAAEKEVHPSCLESLDPSSEMTALGNDPFDRLDPSCPASRLSLGSESSSSSSALVEPLGSSQRESSEVKSLRAAGNSEDGEPSDADSQGANYASYLRTREWTLQTSSMAALEESKGSANDNANIDTQSEASLNSQVNRRGGMKPKIATKPVDSEKRNTEAAPNKSSGNTINSREERGNTFTHSELESKRPSSPRAGVRARGTRRADNFQSSKTETRAEEESERPIKASSNALEKETSFEVAGKIKRPFSPREALQTKAIIKPAIIEKDIKELMGRAGSEECSEKVKTSSKIVSNKMTSSITIYPSEVATSRTSNVEKREKEMPENSDTVTARTSTDESATEGAKSRNRDSNAGSTREREIAKISDSLSTSISESTRQRETPENWDPITARTTSFENHRRRKNPLYSETSRTSIGESPRGRKISTHFDSVTARSTAESTRERETSENSDPVSAKTTIGERASERETSENSDAVSERTSTAESTRQRETSGNLGTVSAGSSTGETAREKETSENSDPVTARTTSIENLRRRKTPLYSETIITSRTSTGERPRGRKISTYSDFATSRTSTAESPRERETSENSDIVFARTSTAESTKQRETSGNSDTVSARTSIGERARERETSENSDAVSAKTSTAESLKGRKTPVYSETIITARTSKFENSWERETSEYSETATVGKKVHENARKRESPTSSDSVSVRTSLAESGRERHTSTSNIKIIPNEIPVVTNSINAPFEISINKSEVSLKVSELEMPGDLSPKNKADVLVSRSSITIKPPEPTEKKSSSNQATLENISWKSHALKSDPAEMKSTTAGSSWRTRRLLKSLEELDGKVDRSRDSVDRSSAWWNRPSLLDTEAKPGKARELYSRRTSAIIHSWNTPEFVSRRSKSSLCASEIGSRRSYNHDLLLSPSLGTWDQTRLWEESSDLLASSRRRRDRERAQRTDLAGKRSSSRAVLQSDSNPKGSKVEERVRQLNHYMEEK